MDPARAVPEVARVLVPGGQLGLVWNMRDERADWVAQLGRILHDPGEGDGSRGGAVAIGPPFGPVQHRTIEWTHRLTRDQLLDMVSSRSYVITMPAAQRAEVLAAVGRLADTHPDLAGRAELELPYRTECFRRSAELTAGRPLLCERQYPALTRPGRRASAGMSAPGPTVMIVILSDWVAAAGHGCARRPGPAGAPSTRSSS